MKILIDIDDDYAKALALLSLQLGRKSRNALMGEILQGFVEEYPQVLHQVATPVPLTRVKLKPGSGEYEAIPIKIDLYRFTHKDGTIAEGRGRLAAEAFFAATGKSKEEFISNWEKYEIVQEETKG